MQRRHHGPGGGGCFSHPLTLQGSVVTIGVNTTPTTTGSVPLAKQKTLTLSQISNLREAVYLLRAADRLLNAAGANGSEGPRGQHPHLHIATRALAKARSYLKSGMTMAGVQ